EVDTVLEDVLRVHLESLAVQPLLRVVVVGTAAVCETREPVRCIEKRVAPLDVVPDVHGLVALDDGVRADATAPVGPILVGNAHIAALVVPLPPVEWALNDLALDVTTVAEVCAEMLAVSLH